MPGVDHLHSQGKYTSRPIPGSGAHMWGSGENPNQRDKSLSKRVSDLKKSGIKETEIANILGFKSTTELRKAITLDTDARKFGDRGIETRIRKLYIEEGIKSPTEIARRLGSTGISESKVRYWKKKIDEGNIEKVDTVCETLKQQVKDKKMIDVGLGAASVLQVRQSNLDGALKKLQEEGYGLYKISAPNQFYGSDATRSIKTLCEPGISWVEARQRINDIKSVNDYIIDASRTLQNVVKPVSIDSSRIMVSFKGTDGDTSKVPNELSSCKKEFNNGDKKDGIIEIRRGVEDLNLGQNNYAQVRIAVDGTHYLKGVAVYADDLPKGIDIRFNTSKSVDTPMIGPDKNNTILKPLSDNKENPFGATIKYDDKLKYGAATYIGKDGKQHQSALNIVNEEGTWSEWSKSLSAQFLSKQPNGLAKRQLELTKKIQERQFNDIMKLENPVVKQMLLDKFAKECDSKSVHLKAAATPRSSSHLLLPVMSLKENEIYAPKYNNGEYVYLIRYPHAGIFEIPRLKVNNNNKEAKALFPEHPARDAVCINPKVAQILSGADFDGDAAFIIPENDKVKLSYIDPYKKKEFKSLVEFEPKDQYPGYEGMRAMTKEQKGQEMGKITNLLTDMQLANASSEEVARAAKFSKVVIDAEKHKLDWRRAEKDFRISELRKEYQNGHSGGTHTLISRSNSEDHIPKEKIVYLSQMTPEEKKRYYEGEIITRPTGERKKQYIVESTGKALTNKEMDSLPKDPKTGKSIFPKGSWQETGDIKTYKTKKGYTHDPWELTSGGSKDNPGTSMEAIYAEYASAMKALGNRARKESRTLEYPPVDKEAKKIYSAEISVLNDKIKEAEINRSLEREAVRIADEQMKIINADNPDMSYDDKQKKRAQCIQGARNRIGKESYTLDITPKEWEAIQSHALSKTAVEKIIKYADIDKVKEYATPKQSKTLSAFDKSMIKAYINSGYSYAEIAEKMHISESTISKYA